MKPFEIQSPDSVENAVSFLQQDNSLIKAMSGGTALMLMMKAGVYEPQSLIHLSNVSALKGISIDAQGVLHIGAMTTLSELEHSPLIQQHFSVISKTMKHLANVRVRNVACVGGALAHGDPHMDMPPLMTALGAQLQIKSKNSSRVLPIENFYEGYYTTKLNSDEIIASVSIPSIQNRHCLYLKCTTRVVDDWPTLGVAVNLGYQDQQIVSPRIILSAVVETPTRLLQVEDYLQGKPLTDQLIREGAELASESVHPQDDARGSSGYKHQLIKVNVRRAIQKSILEKAQS
jgi:carbon-monoxide dehydrogenase medium subunit